MGILRADRITGLGGANAITGSTFFAGTANTGNYLRIDTGGTEDFTFGTGDFTIEFWINSQASGFQQHPYDARGTTNTNRLLIYMDTNNTMYYFASGGARITSSSALPKDEWVHFALVRASGSTKMYFNGTQTGSTYSDTIDFLAPTHGSAFIGSNGGTDGIEPSGGGYFNGFLSNYRIVKGTAVYTANFTPPNTRLPAIDGTVLLTCISSGDVSKTEGGNYLLPSAKNSNSTPPVASSFTPNTPVGFSTTTDVGSQYGSTFDGFGSFATSTYMVPPGGNTRERNRGRALFGGGSTIDNTIQSLIIQSQGNTIDFGDLSTGRYETECASSSTRGIWGGGYTESPNVKVDVIEFVTIANSSNTTDFGNLTVARGHLAGMCNSTRGVFANGSTDPGPTVNTLDYITIATAGNATDFGDSTTASKPMGGGRSSTTRGIFTLGNAPSAVNNIEYITIASTGDSQDFGDLTGFSGWGKGAGNISSGTRAILGGGHEALNNIEYITIASLGNGTDFGDLIVGRRSAFTAGSKTRGVFGGGKNPSQLNSIEYVEIATTGNALDFGDMINSKSFSSGLSDCHGGLS